MYSYVTLLGTRNYLPGVFALNESLRRSGARHPLLVAIAKDVPPAVADQLHAAGIRAVWIPTAPPVSEKLKEISGHWGHTYDKISIFGLPGYDKLVYVDSDMMILENIDELFDRPHLSAVAAGRSLDAGWNRLNSGLMVIEPRPGLDQEIFSALPAALEQLEAINDGAIGDQDIINAYIPSWPVASELHLDESYNIFQGHVDSYVNSFGYSIAGLRPGGDRRIKIIHFIGSMKPWMKGAVVDHFMNFVRARKFNRLENRLFFAYRQLIGQSLPTH